MTQKLTLPIKVGKKYVRRDGVVVTAQAPYSGFDKRCCYVGTADKPERDGGIHVWSESGRVSSYVEVNRQFDLVADFVEESPKKPKKSVAKQPVKETKMYTLEQFLHAVLQSANYDLQGYGKDIQKELDKITDPEYTEYLRLKNKFEN